METSNNNNDYWKANISLIFQCLAVWFISSYVCGILLFDQLNNFNLGGYQLGFWFAQQGSIYTFLIVIFYYAYRMNSIDKKFGVDEE